MLPPPQDLYSDDTHFLLEMLQNADDNSYAQGVVPALSLELRADSLTVTNNEVGFSEANVESMCSMACSSKSKKLGQTGEKGACLA